MGKREERESGQLLIGEFERWQERAQGPAGCCHSVDSVVRAHALPVLVELDPPSLPSLIERSPPTWPTPEGKAGPPTCPLYRYRTRDTEYSRSLVGS